MAKSLDVTPKAQPIKQLVDKADVVGMKNAHLWKMKRRTSFSREGRCAGHVSGTGRTSKPGGSPSQRDRRQRAALMWKRAEDMDRHFAGEGPDGTLAGAELLHVVSR